MPATNTTSSSGLLFGLGVIGVAAILAVWQAYGGKRMPTDSPLEIQHYQRQAVRRWVVALLMAVLGALLIVGTQIPHRVGAKPNPTFLLVWLVNFLLVIALPILALVDWVATYRYGQARRLALSQEGIAILRDELARRASLKSTPQNGSTQAADPPHLSS